jgi:hypothetical protein
MRYPTRFVLMRASYLLFLYRIKQNDHWSHVGMVLQFFPCRLLYEHKFKNPYKILYIVFFILFKYLQHITLFLGKVQITLQLKMTT